MVNFPTWIPDYGSHSPALLELFISSNVSICSKMAFPPLENSDHVVALVSIDFLSNSKRDTPFHRIAHEYSCADWDGLCDPFRDVPWEDVFTLSACAAVIVYKNLIFRLYQQNGSSKSKVKFRHASNCCKRDLEAAKLAHLNKTKESITFQKLGSRDFWQIADSVVNKGKSVSYI